MKIDNKIIKKVQNNDYDTIEKIYDKYFKLVKYVVFQVTKSYDDIEDLVQEVFMKVFKKLDTYDVNQPFNNWITVVAKNTALDYLKFNKNRINGVKKEANNKVYKSDDGDNKVLDNLDWKLKKYLTDEEYFIVTYRLYFDFKFIDIAHLLDLSVSKVYSRYSKAIKKLKKVIKKEDFYDWDWEANKKLSSRKNVL